METVKATKARNNFQEIIDKVHYTHEPVVISKHGKPWVMVQSLPEEDKELKDITKNKE